MLLLIDCGPHAHDGDLVRLLDGELDETAARRVRDHLALCSGCERRARAFARVGTRFANLMDALGTAELIPLKRPGRLTLLLRRHAVATAVVLVALALALTPLRAWIALGWRALGTWRGPAPTAVAAATPASVVSFVPGSRTFRVAVASTQAGGSLTLVVHFLPSATLRIMRADSLHELVVLSDGLHIQNHRASATTYELSLPAELDAVEVVLGGETVMRFAPARMDAGTRWVIPLGGRRD